MWLSDGKWFWIEVGAAAFEDVAVGKERIRAAHKQKYLEGCTAR
jgi:hypothetical protein